ncbi:MAG TPA: hypothetical protein VFV64_07680 [Permianibacter sp.]|nr:hypothetical protein [Permianibacter sp.]
MRVQLGSSLLVVSCFFLGPYASADIVVRTIAGESAICRGFEAEINSRYAYKKFEYPGFESIHVTQGFEAIKLPVTQRVVREPMTVDFNNDGTIDQVFQYDDAGSYITGTILYVLPDVELADLSTAAGSLKGFNIFPCQYDKSHPSVTECPTVSQKADEAGIEFVLGRKVFFRGRYTEMRPLRYNGETFVQLRSMSEETKQYWATMKPTGKAEFEPICLFERAQ